MKAKITIFYVLMLLLFISLKTSYATMDWQNWTISVSDVNPLEIAQNIKSELYALSYDENRVVMDFLASNFSRETMLNDVFSQNRKLNQNYLTDGSVEYYSQLVLTGKIMALLVPETKAPKLVVPMLCPCCGQDWPKDKSVPNGMELVPKEIEMNEYTGIVIDCRQISFAPSLFPRILSDLGEEIYSVNFADPRYVIDVGLVLYSTSDPYNNSRVGYNPLRIQAMSAAGSKMHDIKISSFDARRIHGSKKNLALLKECRVAIIFGQ